MGFPVQDPALRRHEAVHQPLVQPGYGFDDALVGMHGADRKRHAGMVTNDQGLDEYGHGAGFRCQSQFLPV